MDAAISLRKLLEELDTPIPGLHVYVHQRTGEVYSGTDEYLELSESDKDEESLPAWQSELMKKLREVLDSTDWLEVPLRRTGQDYNLMEQFCLEETTDLLQEDLLDAIRGSGAFGRFKRLADRHGLLPQWFAYREAAIREDLKSWLEANGLEYCA